MMREEVLASVARIGGRLGELRLDTDLDISHGVVRYLELVKLAALLQRPPGESVEEALADLNARLLAAATPLQREIFQTSTLDEVLLTGEREGDAGTEAVVRSRIGHREEPSLGPFLPRKGARRRAVGVGRRDLPQLPAALQVRARAADAHAGRRSTSASASPCTSVLERYHSDGASTLAQMLDLLDDCWRRGGFGDSEPERELREKASAALERYHARLPDEQSEPVWFERSFAFRLGPHHVRGRVDRVDRLPPGSATREYELIDYKTSRPKDAEQLQDDVQLSLYALAAREAWQLQSSRQAYYYVLDDRKVPVPRGERDLQAVKRHRAAGRRGNPRAALRAHALHAVCSICDYRLACPVAERLARR